MSRETLRVPTPTVPALMGLKGGKIKKGIRISSSATIFYKMSQESRYVVLCVDPVTNKVVFLNSEEPC